jgi:hypothetical protein
MSVVVWLCSTHVIVILRRSGRKKRLWCFGIFSRLKGQRGINVNQGLDNRREKFAVKGLILILKTLFPCHEADTWLQWVGTRLYGSCGAEVRIHVNEMRELRRASLAS